MPTRPYDCWALHLPTGTVAWLADHPHTRQFVRSVWDKLTELERSGQYSGAIDALRRVLTHHQPTSAGRCRTCARATGRRRPFPCIVWHQIHCDLLGLVAGAGPPRRASSLRPVDLVQPVGAPVQIVGMLLAAVSTAVAAGQTDAVKIAEKLVGWTLLP